MLATLSCSRASIEDVRRWKDAPDGTEKLTALLRNKDQPLPLRAEAAAMLVERGDVDRVEGTVAASPIDQRAPLVLAIVPAVRPTLDGGDAAKSWEAKDALYGLRRQATTESERNAIDAALFPAFERDLRAGRTDGPRQTLVAMLAGIGAATVPLLQRILAEPTAPYVAAVEALNKVGDRAAREAGGAALTKRARALGEVPPELWKALGTLGGAEAVTLASDTVKSGGPAALPAAEALASMRRDPAMLPFALEIAGKPATSDAVRTQMLKIVKTVGDENARKGVVGLIAPERDSARRYLFYKAALEIGRNQSVFPALEALPVKATYQPAEVKEHLVKPLVEMGGLESREGMWKAFESKSPVARMVAVMAMEDLGFKDDVPVLEKLKGDRARVAGLPSTVGAEAARIAAVLKTRG